MCRIIGYKIHPAAKIGISLIMPATLEMGENCSIGHFTICRSSVDRIAMADDSRMGSFHLITGISTKDKRHFQHVKDRKCELVMETGVGIPSRKFLDCNGGIYIGAFSTIAGQWTQFLTHSIDIYNSRQDAKPIRIGKYCFIGTGCILLPGAELPDYSVLGAGSVLNKKYTESGCVYAGAPAVVKKRIDPNMVPWMQRKTLAVE
jgi:acetyltransferase-like isoleucine patch superfamily enzyme